MKISHYRQRNIAILTLLFVLVGAVNSALASPKSTPKLSVRPKTKQLIFTGMNQGISWQVFLLNTKPAGQIKVQDEVRKLYLVDLETIVNKTTTTKFIDLVQCSTTSPFVATRDSTFNSKNTYVAFLNPGGDISGANYSTHMLYWTVCHGLKNAQGYQLEELKSLAKRLGYTTELENPSVEIPNWDYEKLKP